MTTTNGETMTASIKRSKLLVKELLTMDIPYERSQKLYRDWALDGEAYEEMCKSNVHYNGPKYMVAKMAELFPCPATALVLDIGAGTGILGEMLREVGFRRFHGLEPLKEFADVMDKKGIYEKVLNEGIGMGSAVSADAETYNAVIASGAFGPGHIPCKAVEEVVRVLKPGGYFINSMRKEFLSTVPEYKDRLEPLLEKLEQGGVWQRQAWESYPNHFIGTEGLLMVFQKC